MVDLGFTLGFEEFLVDDFEGVWFLVNVTMKSSALDSLNPGSVAMCTGCSGFQENPDFSTFLFFFRALLDEMTRSGGLS